MDKTLDLDELERVARAATPGPWQMNGVRGKFAQLNDDAPFHSVGPDADAIAAVFYDPKTHTGFMDAKFIATFDPPTILTLIAAARPAVVSDEVVEAMDAAFWDVWNVGGEQPCAAMRAALALLPGGEGEGSSCTDSAAGDASHLTASETPSELEREPCWECGLDWCGVTCGRWPKWALDARP